jgi:hypothetical protein
MKFNHQPKNKKKPVKTRNKTLTSNVDGNDESVRTSGLFPSPVVIESLRVEEGEVVRAAVEDYVLEEYVVEGVVEAVGHLL